MASTKTIKMTGEEWVKKGEKLYGKDRKEWKFKCPACGYVQSFRDFEPHMDKEEIYKYIAFSCIGRFDGHGDNTMFRGKQPCNYAGGGLFAINPVHITDDEGNEYHRFDFADSEASQS